MLDKVDQLEEFIWEIRKKTDQIADIVKHQLPLLPGLAEKLQRLKVFKVDLEEKKLRKSILDNESWLDFFHPMEITITHVESVHSFFARLNCKSKKDGLFLEKINQLYKNFEAKIDYEDYLRNNDFCVVRLFSNEVYDPLVDFEIVYYRGLILKFSHNFFKIFLVDHGATVTVSRENVFQMAPSLNGPALVYNFHFQDCLEEYSTTKDNSYLESELRAKSLTCTFRVRLAPESINSSENLTDLNVINYPLEKIEYRCRDRGWLKLRSCPIDPLPKFDSLNLFDPFFSISKNLLKEDSKRCDLFEIYEMFASKHNLIDTGEDIFTLRPVWSDPAKLVGFKMDSSLENFTANLSQFCHSDIHRTLRRAHDFENISYTRLAIFHLEDRTDLYFRCFLLDPPQTTEASCLCFAFDFGFLARVPLRNLFPLPASFGLERVPKFSYCCSLGNTFNTLNCSTPIEVLIKLTGYSLGVHHASIIDINFKN